MPDVSLGLAGSFAHGRVIQELYAPDDPAVGAGFSYQVPGSYWERPTSLTFLLTIENAEDPPQPNLIFADGDGVTVAAIDPSFAVGYVTSQFTYLSNIATAPATQGVFTTLLPLPSFFMQPTWTMTFALNSDSEEDAVTGIRYYRERFITGPGGYEIGVQRDETDERTILLGKLADLLS